ncbi:MAG: mannose-1-phosphate guanylyltransferase/mannose-6-phosphate isomerase [Acidimicrobiia bacterium]
MSRPTIVPVILSGGAGTRLWPVSRANSPKQLHSLVGDRSMIQETVDRASGLDGLAPPVIVTSEALGPRVAHTLRAAGTDRFVLMLEPTGRNTAPAVAVAALSLTSNGADALMLVLPADHVITDRNAFSAAVQTGADPASEGRLVTFGISPTAPETGYGYIRRGSEISDGVFTIKEFKEKPDRSTAEQYLASGEYSWNSGMFLLSARSYLSELERLQPDMAQAAQRAWDAAAVTEDVITLEATTFGQVPSESIDYAVMEHTDLGVVVPADPGWSDVGSWSSLWELAVKDDGGNAASGNVVFAGTSNSFVSADERLVALAGVNGLVVVDTPDAVLVTSVDQSQQVKDVVDALRNRSDDVVTTDGTSFTTGFSTTAPIEGNGYRITAVDIQPAGRFLIEGPGWHHVRVESGSGVVNSENAQLKVVADSAATVLDGGHTIVADADGLRILLIDVDSDSEPPGAAQP